LSLLLCMMNIRWSNQWTEAEYRTKLEATGFRLSSWDSLEPHVLTTWLPKCLTAYLDYVVLSVELEVASSRPTAAVVGSGMSGLVAAHLLAETHDVVIFESGPKCGLVGLQQSVSPGVVADVPLRFMMPSYYQMLVKLVQDLQVPLVHVPYNASYQRGETMLLVTSTSWLKHILQHLKYIGYCAKLARVLCFASQKEEETFGEFMRRHRLLEAEAFKIYGLHLSWMLSCSYEQVYNTPASVVLGFVRAGNPFTRMYMRSGNIVRVAPNNSALQEALLRGKQLKLDSPVQPFNKSRLINGEAYDVVIVATDAPAAGWLLGGEVQEMVKEIKVQKSRIVVHRDASLMPPSKEDWRTFNVREDGPNGSCQLTVWLNKFWGRDDLEEDIFESWNPVATPAAELLIQDLKLDRPVYTPAMREVWPRIEAWQGTDGFYLAGAYCLEGMSLLEQACQSAYIAVEAVQRDMASGKLARQGSDEHPHTRTAIPLSADKGLGSRTNPEPSF